MVRRFTIIGAASSLKGINHRSAKVGDVITEDSDAATRLDDFKSDVYVGLFIVFMRSSITGLMLCCRKG